MHFFNAIAIGLMVFFMCLIMKRLRSHNEPTPPFVIWFVPLALTINHVVLQGFVANQWRDAMLQLIAAYTGFITYLYVVGDIHFYRMKFNEQREAQNRPRAPEDDPGWTQYRP